MNSDCKEVGYVTEKRNNETLVHLGLYYYQLFPHECKVGIRYLFHLR